MGNSFRFARKALEISGRISENISGTSFRIRVFFQQNSFSKRAMAMFLLKLDWQIAGIEPSWCTQVRDLVQSAIEPAPVSAV